MHTVKQVADRFTFLIAFVFVLIVWELACKLFKIPVFVLPSPSDVATAFAEVALLGYLVAIAVTLPLAIGITRSHFLSRTLLPWLIVIQSTPIVAVEPIIVVNLGAGVLPRVVITTMIAFFPLVISTATGLASVPPELIELSRSLRASRSREYWQIRMTFAIPYIFSALKVAITLSVIGAVVAEFVAVEKGLGYLILYSTSSFKVAVAFSALVILVSYSLALYGLILKLHKKLFPWSLQ